MENNPNAGATSGQDEDQRFSQAGNAGQNQKSGQKANNRNEMPPAVGEGKAARPGSEDQNEEDQSSENEDEEETDDEISEEDGTEDNEERDQLQQTGGARSEKSGAVYRI